MKFNRLFRRNTGLRVGLVALGASLILGISCSSDDDPGAAATATAPVDAVRNVDVVGFDYGFRDLPTTLAAGSMISFTNESDVEAHELVALRLPDTETRPVAELIRLPDSELGEILSSQPAMVLVAGPEEDAEAVMGNGAFVQPGRYAIVCFVPTGADPDSFLEATEGESEEPPEVEGGEPHALRGMYGEIIVR